MGRLVPAGVTARALPPSRSCTQIRLAPPFSEPVKRTLFPSGKKLGDPPPSTPPVPTRRDSPAPTGTNTRSCPIGSARTYLPSRESATGLPFPATRLGGEPFVPRV